MNQTLSAFDHIQESYEDKESEYVWHQEGFGVLVASQSPQSMLKRSLQMMMSTRGLIDSFLGQPEPMTVKSCEVTVMEKDTRDEHYLKALEESLAYETTLQQATLDAQAFVDHCEKLYEMQTDEFLDWFEQQGGEGNVEMQVWAAVAKSRRKRRRS